MAKIATMAQNFCQMSKVQLFRRSLPQVMSTAAQLSTLPRLPVPPLKQTLNTFLYSVKPYLTDQEFSKTTNVAQRFEKDVGSKLHSLLEKRAEETENWLADWWLQTAYLEYRDPVVVFSSPGQALPFQNFHEEEDRLKYTAKLILAAVDFKTQIDSDKIPVEKMGKDPLDMSQYKKVYGTCRIPGATTDELRFNPDSKYIVIASNNNYFKLPVYGSDGKCLNEAQIIEQLVEIQLKALVQGISVGVLTSQNRDDWAASYHELIQLGNNKYVIETIQNSLFLVCLDDALPNQSKLDRQTLAGLQLIHAMGSRGNINNRWYDKTMQFVISQDGIVGMTYEHSPSEGQPIAVLSDYIVDYMEKGRGGDLQPADQVERFEQLQFTVDQNLIKHIRKALINIDKLVENLELNCFTYKSYGKEFIKSQKMSPDSFIQMAIQFAFYRIHKVPGAHYESASLRKYIHGRTETIRSCSNESVAFARTMLDETATNAEKAAALRAAVQSHKQYTVHALNGNGVDRHLLGLKMIAKQYGIPLPEFFTDEGFLRSTRFRLSTSQVASRCDGFMCYAPLVPDGYGCCYNPRPNTMNFGVSAFIEDHTTNAVLFGNALVDSLNDMEYVLARTQKSKL